MSLENSSSKVLETNEETGIPKCFSEILDDAIELDYVGMHGKTPSVNAYRVYTIMSLIGKLKNIGLYSIVDKVYFYNGSHWKSLDKGIISGYLSKLSLKYGVPIVIAKDYKFIDELYKQFTSECGVICKKIYLDIAQLNLGNGTLKVENGERKMFPYSKEDYFYYTLGFNYDANAKCLLFDKFLCQSIPNQELQDIVAEYLGTIFIPNQANTFQSEKFLAMQGKGSNGKGVLTKILTALFGKENVTSFGLDDLTDTQGNSRAMIENKLLNIASETGRKLNDNNFKILASGEEIMVKRLFKDVSLMSDYAKIIVSINKSFYGGDKTHAYYRRFMIIPFDNVIAEEDKDKRLADKIIATELSGVLNWVLDGLDRYMSREGQFTKSKIVDDALRTFQMEDNNPLAFIDDEGYFITADFQEVQPIYTNFQEWCKDNGIKNIETQQTFTKAIDGVKIRGKETEVKGRGGGRRRTSINITKRDI